MNVEQRQHVSVFWCRLEQTEYEDAGTTLSPRELDRAARFRRAIDRERWVAARAWMRMLLGHRLGLEPREIRFMYGPQGKPTVANKGHEFSGFNLSHSSGFAVLAVSGGFDVGVDVEFVREVPDLEAVAEVALSFAEQAAIGQLTPELRLRRFFEYWTFKEAVLKAFGDGIGQLSEVDMHDAGVAGRVPNMCRRTDDHPWSAVALSLPNPLVGSVAITGNTGALEVAEVEVARRQDLC